MQEKTMFILLLVVSVAIGFVHCEREDDEDEGTSLWSRLKEMAKKFAKSTRELWRQMKEEIKARTVDMSSWTTEMFESFKVRMKEWVDHVDGASTREREDMRSYIERLEMPNQEGEQK